MPSISSLRRGIVIIIHHTEQHCTNSMLFWLTTTDRKREEKRSECITKWTRDAFKMNTGETVWNERRSLRVVGAFCNEHWSIHFKQMPVNPLAKNCRKSRPCSNERYSPILLKRNTPHILTFYNCLIFTLVHAIRLIGTFFVHSVWVQYGLKQAASQCVFLCDIGQHL